MDPAPASSGNKRNVEGTATPSVQDGQVACDRELDTLRKQYFALVPPYLLTIPSAETLRTPDAQAALVRLATTEEPPQPEAGYRKKFWKRVLAALEASWEAVDTVEEGGEEDGVDERIYEAVADAMAAPGSLSGMPAPSPKTFIYTPPSGAERRITLYEEQVAVQAGTTGLRTWTAALHLAHHFLQQREALFGRQPTAVVELGAGTGFLSGVMALEGVDVLATDLGDGDSDGDEGVDEGGVGEVGGSGAADGLVDEEEERRGGEEGQRQTPLARLAANIAQNNLPVPVLPLDWAHASLPPAQRPRAWSAVLAPVDSRQRDVVAADVIYDPEIVPLLVSAIRVLLTETCGGKAEVEGKERPVAVLAATVRNEDTFKLFLDTCLSSGLTTTILPLPPMDEKDPTFWDTALDRGTRVEIVRITAA